MANFSMTERVKKLRKQSPSSIASSRGLYSHPKPAPSPWTPSQINTVFWYDAADLSTITTNITNNVTQMLDKSGNSWTLAPLTSGKIGPKSGTQTINGLNVLEYSTGVSNVLENNLFGETQPLCIMFVVRFVNDAIAGEQDFMFSGTETTTTRIGFRRTTNNQWQILTNGQSISTLAGTAPEGNTYIASFYCGGAPGTSSIRSNGAIVPSGTTITNNNFTSLNIGNNELENTAMDGFIAEVVSFKDPIHQEITEGYLAWKWGLNSNLPDTHPYKNNSPTL